MLATVVESVFPVHIEHSVHRVRPSHMVYKVPPAKVDGDLVVGGCLLEHPEGDSHGAVLVVTKLTTSHLPALGCGKSSTK